MQLCKRKTKREEVLRCTKACVAPQFLERLGAVS